MARVTIPQPVAGTASSSGAVAATLAVGVVWTSAPIVVTGGATSLVRAPSHFVGSCAITSAASARTTIPQAVPVSASLASSASLSVTARAFLVLVAPSLSAVSLSHGILLAGAVRVSDRALNGLSLADGPVWTVGVSDYAETRVLVADAEI